MFDRVVVGTDGSERARRAVDVAAEVARRFGAALELVTVVPERDAIGVVGASVAVADPTGSTALRKAAALEALEALAKELSGLEVRCHVESGSAAEGILKVAEAVGADCIVVGNRGMTGARRVLGSVPATVAHHAPCHVLVAKTDSD
jgi:nucleotide-binding universal stress UspA family protein